MRFGVRHHLRWKRDWLRTAHNGALSGSGAILQAGVRMARASCPCTGETPVLPQCAARFRAPPSVWDVQEVAREAIQTPDELRRAQASTGQVEPHGRRAIRFR